VESAFVTDVGQGPCPWNRFTHPVIAQTGDVFQRFVIDAQPLSEDGSDALTTPAPWILRAPHPYYGSPAMCHEPTHYRLMMSDEYRDNSRDNRNELALSRGRAPGHRDATGRHLCLAKLNRASETPRLSQPVGSAEVGGASTSPCDLPNGEGVTGNGIAALLLGHHGKSRNHQTPGREAGGLLRLLIVGPCVGTLLREPRASHYSCQSSRMYCSCR
jgi:hypothetical protein